MADHKRNSEFDPMPIIDAVDELNDGFTLCDADDNLVFCNKRQKELFPGVADLLVPGTPFETIVRQSAERGIIADIAGHEEDWIAGRMAAHLTDDASLFEQESADGAWIEIRETKLADGCRVGIRTDITERKRSEQALLRSEEKFRDFTEVASDWFWEMGPDLRFTFFSERVEQIVGVPPAFHIGKTRDELAGEDATTEKWQRHLQDLRDHKPFRDFRYDRMGPHGRLQYLSSSGKPVFDENGKFCGYIGIGSDLTHQIEAEEQAKLANERLAAAVDALSEPFVLWDAEDRLVIANQRFREINAAVGDKVEPGTLYDVFARTLLEHRLIPEAFEEEEQWLAQRLDQHRDPAGPFEQRRLDGSWFMIYEQRLRDGSTATISTDITNLKDAESKLQVSQERFRDFANVAADWFWEQDTDLRFTNVTEDNVAVTGMKQEDHYGKTRRETGLLDVSEAEMDEHEALLLAREPFTDFRFSRLRPDGEKVFISVGGKPFYDAQGIFSGYRGAGRDITRIVEAERIIKAERDRAEAANRAKSEFLAQMSHDFRTPLNAIIGFSQVLLQQIYGPLGDERYAEYVDHIFKSGNLLLEFVNDLLDISKIESGEFDLEIENVALEELVGEMRDLYGPQFAEQNLTFETRIAPEVKTVRADRSGLLHMLINILSNAGKFTPAGGSIALCAKDVDGATTISVEDTGIGFDEDELETILSPFGRARGAAEHGIQGTGLGLSIVKSMMEAHGGRLELSSPPQKGVKASLIFPAA